MSQRSITGAPASPGAACGAAWQLRAEANGQGRVPPPQRERERDAALTALAAAANDLSAVASELSPDHAAIIEAGVLMAEDPALTRTVEEKILSEGLTAAGAIDRATGEYADAIAAIGDERLAARADDVRSLGRRAARIAAGGGDDAPPGAGLILIARDLGPGDVAELADALAGVALAGGGATAHAAIVARSLGIPMLTGLGDSVLEIPDGTPLALDASEATLVVEPTASQAAQANAEMRGRAVAAQRAQELREHPAVTVDGIRVTVLANVAGAGELELAIRSGAEGIGLLRTELAFLQATGWPNEQEHAEMLGPILRGLGQLPAAVRVLDFGADKAPPFLHDVRERGLELLLSHPDAFVQQLHAILVEAQEHDVRILLPMVQSPEEVTATRGLIADAASTLGLSSTPPLGSMIETPSAARRAGEIARQCEFLSIGTNDLTAATLEADRFAVNSARAHHPAVLRSIASSVAAAHQAGIPIEVCGEAASDPTMLPLLVGLGVDEVSVAAARVGEVRDWIRRLDATEAAGIAQSALTMGSAEAVAQLTAGLLDARAIPATR